MSYNDTVGTNRRAGARPTRRFARAGIAAIVGGLALIPLSMVSDATVGADEGMRFALFGLAVAALLLALAAAVAGAYGKFAPEFGAVRKAVTALYALDLGLLGLVMGGYGLSVWTFESGPFGVVPDVLWVGMFILASLFGLALWRTSASRRTAVLFAALLPVIFGGLFLMQRFAPAVAESNLSGLLFGIPMGLAFVSLGLDLRASDRDRVAADPATTA